MRIAPGRPRFNSLLISIFAIAGLLLATAGIYGSASYAVGLRTHEFGIRAALGARPGQVRSLVLRTAAGIAAAGIAFGLAGVSLLTRVLGDLLFEVAAVDPVTYGAAAAFLAIVVLVASYLPARRAMRVDPAASLR